VREERILNAKQPHENIGAFDGKPHKPLDSAKRHDLPLASETDAKSKNAPLSSDDDVCAQTYQTEAKTDYQTCDMWKTLSLRGGFPGDYYSTLNPKKLPQDDKYKVFIMPMTHVDPGWLETFDEYSKDTNNILTYMLRFLKAHKDMRFTWCELVFFER
uniref:Glycoside hydrolase family 38 N-terminal domain-containing protein n=1 Tax=Plectus sambesii TaxID=2011161 RepID=A0A914VKN2_9BILA